MGNPMYIVKVEDESDIQKLLAARDAEKIAWEAWSVAQRRTSAVKKEVFKKLRPMTPDSDLYNIKFSDGYLVVMSSWLD